MEARLIGGVGCAFCDNLVRWCITVTSERTTDPIPEGGRSKLMLRPITSERRAEVPFNWVVHANDVMELAYGLLAAASGHIPFIGLR